MKKRGPVMSFEDLKNLKQNREQISSKARKGMKKWRYQVCTEEGMEVREAWVPPDE